MSLNLQRFLLWICFNTLITSNFVYGELKDITLDALGTHTKGLLAAFGDFNADKNSDIFIIGNDGESLSSGIYEMVT